MLGTPRPRTGAARQAAARASQRTGIRLVGPGSLGLARPAARLNLTVARPAIAAGSLAIVSQSSAVCAALLDFAEGSGIGVSTVAALGSGIDVDVSEVLDYLSYDGTTRSIAVYIDGVRDARRLLSTLRAAARGKPVVILKSGQNDVGTRARLTHTDVLASDHETFRSALRRCGAVSVDSFGELFSAVEWLEQGRKVRGDRLAIVTNGGGLGALSADACRRHAVGLATLSEATVAALGEHLPRNWSGGNPGQRHAGCATRSDRRRRQDGGRRSPGRRGAGASSARPAPPIPPPSPRRCSRSRPAGRRCTASSARPMRSTAGRP